MTLSTPITSEANATTKKNITRLIVATSVGNALEWYDIAVYAYFAVYLSKAFFPANDPTTSLLLTFGSFGLSFLIRPIGGVVLGAYADRHGRKASLMLSIVLMTFGTLVLALMPTFETIGILAPIAVMLARLVQGFSAGGEFGSSTALLVEHMPERRGFVASWQFASQGVSGLLGAGFGALLTSLMSPEDLQSWGWRLPFLLAFIVATLTALSYLELVTKYPQAAGAALEFGSNITTRVWEGAARLQGLNPTVDYPAQGLHNWEQFGYQLNRSKPQVLNVMNAW
mgnify:CR=1 FL=1